MPDKKVAIKRKVYREISSKYMEKHSIMDLVRNVAYTTIIIRWGLAVFPFKTKSLFIFTVVS